MSANSSGTMQPPSTSSGANNESNTPSQGGGNQRRRGNRNQQQQQRHGSLSTRFVGSEPQMNGNIYDFVPSAGSNRFVETTRELAIFIGRKYTEHTAELVQAVVDLQFDDPTTPAEPAATATPVQMKRWEFEEKDYRSKLKAYNDFRAGLYSTVLGQCTEALRAKLEAREEFVPASQDGIALLRLIRTVTHTFEKERSNLANEINKLKGKFYSMKQGKYENLVQYHRRFESMVAAMEAVEISLTEPCMIKQVAASHGRTQLGATASDKEEAKQRLLANQFIRSANYRYDAFRRELEHSMLNERDEYPKSVAAALEIMERRGDNTVIHPTEGSGVAFATAGMSSEVEASGNDSQQARAASGRHAHIQCFACGQMGHYANQCSNGNREQQGGATLAQSSVEIPNTWILLDNQSTLHLFCNLSLLKDVQPTDNDMKVVSNGGSMTTNMKGTYPGFGEVWYDPNAITNILSLSSVQKRYRVSYDSGQENTFKVHLDNGEIMQFKESPSGLHYFDTDRAETEMAFINMVEDKKAKYSNEDYQRAMLARKTQVLIGRPSTREYIRIVQNGHLPNCPIHREDILAAEDIFGPEVGSLKGKTTRMKAPKVEEDRYDGVPAPILSRYHDVTLCVDIMFVNKIPFVVTMSKHIRFITVEAIANRKVPAIWKAIKDVIKIYQQKGFQIKWALMDNEFEPLRGELANSGIGLNVTSQDEHVPQIERMIRTIKERARATYNMLPFKQMPPILVIEMIKAAVFWLNAFPITNGVSDQLSPRTMVK
jgi:hypothetical protein